MLRTERELHGVLQKKYDIMQAANGRNATDPREQQSLGERKKRQGFARVQTFPRRGRPPPNALRMAWFGESQTDQRQAGLAVT